MHPRMNVHCTTIRTKKPTSTAEHFSSEYGGCDITYLQVQLIKQLSCEGKNSQSERLQREISWIKELRTLTPYGLNDRLGSHDWR